MLHVLVGTVVGALGGAAIAAGSDLLAGRRPSWKKVVAGAAGGAVVGAVTSLTFGAGALAATAATRTGGMVLAGAGGGATEQLTDNALHGRPLHQGVAKQTVVGGALGLGGAGLREGGKLLASSSGREAVRRGLGQTFSGPRRAWGAYMRQLDTHPLRTKMATSATLSGTGDLLAQVIGGKEIDYGRVAFMTAFGGLWSGPVGHYWLGFLARAIPGTGLRAVGTRVLVDQGLMSPFGTAVYFSATGVYEGRDPRQELRDKFWPTMLASWGVWVPVSGVSFRFVPTKLQPLFGSVIGLAWGTWVAGVSQEDTTAPPPPARDDGAGLPGGPVLAARGAAEPEKPVSEPAAAPTPAPPAPASRGFARALQGQ